jgi:ectoine hydroxylase-related dioxygenase (phytanoyl-CoA dioxygenase family)
MLAPLALLRVNPASDEAWLDIAVDALRDVGGVVVEGVIDAGQLEQTRAALYAAQQRIQEEVGLERLERAGELGVLRLMAKYEPSLLALIAQPHLLAIVDAMIGDTAILHLQNGFVLPSKEPDPNGRVFQQSFHRDFPRHLEGYLASLNALIAVDAFTEENGGTIVVPGSQQRPDQPSQAYLSAAAEPVECPAGSAIVFDSTLWHAAGINRSGHDRLGINQQYTRSFFKQQVDYVRALGDETVLAQPPRVQQLLGWYTRVVTSLDEYYRPAEDRLYRSGQG